MILAKLVSAGGVRPPIAELASDLAISPSQVHAALRRLERSRLIEPGSCRPLLRAVEEFLLHGVKYAFPAQRGEATRGIATGYAADPLRGEITAGDDPPPVWPDAGGDVRGMTFEPIHKAVPAAVRKDPVLYQLLALIDAIRDGRARERQLAERMLRDRLRALLRG